MAANKQFQGLAPTGLTLYFEAWNSLGEFCDHTDGDFRDPAANTLLPATEKLATGVYYRDENRMTWIDDTVNYRLVDALGAVYAVGGQIETRNDVPIVDRDLWQFLIELLQKITSIMLRK